MLDPRIEGSYSRSICMRERILRILRFASRRSLSSFIIYQERLPSKGPLLSRIVDTSIRQSYIDNFPLVSRACQSFLASSRPRQDFTHSLCARRPFEAQSIHRSAGFLRALRHPCGERDVSREADICTRRETSAPDRSALRRACKQRNSFERVFVVRAIVG